MLAFAVVAPAAIVIAGLPVIGLAVVGLAVVGLAMMGFTVAGLEVAGLEVAGLAMSNVATAVLVVEDKRTLFATSARDEEPEGAAVGATMSTGAGRGVDGETLDAAAGCRNASAK